MTATQPSAVNVPNALTVLRIFLVPVFVWLLLHESGQDAAWRIAAGVAFALAAATDYVDGRIARAQNLITDFGKIADPIADKALIGSALIGLSLIEVLPWWVTVVILVREIAVTFARFAVLDKAVLPASRGGKLKTVLQSITLAGFILPLVEWWGKPIWLVLWSLLLAAVVITVVTGVEYLVQIWRLRTSG